MITVYTGIPGSGKSLKMAKVLIDILYRNKKWFEKTGIRRFVVSNLKLANDVELEFDGFVKYWVVITYICLY